MGCCGNNKSVSAEALELGFDLSGKARPPLRHGELEWSPLPAPVCKRLNNIVRAWENTPHRGNTQVRGAGVDCLHFVGAVLDAMHRRPTPTPIPAAAPDAGVGSDSIVLDIRQRMLAAFPDLKLTDDGTVQPGDILVTRSEGTAKNTRPGHLVVACGDPWRIAHVSNKVVVTSIEAMQGVLFAYRPAKDDWE